MEVPGHHRRVIAPRVRATLATVAVAGAAAGLIAACGDDGGDLSRSAYIAQADEACAEINQRFPPPGPTISPEEIVAAGRVELRARTELLRRLRKLRPPADLRAR